VTAPWAPPAGWIPLSSQVPGIQVWGPRPHDDADTEAPEGAFRCEQCGGAVGFDVASGVARCGFCDHLAGPGAALVGRGARNQAFTDQAIAQAEQGWQIARKELHCDGCGVDLAVEPGDIATTCTFCGSAQVLLRESVVAGLRPSAVLPFVIQDRALRDKVDAWLGRGWIHPPDLRRGAVLDKLAGVYVPFWNFDAAAHADWEAEVGTRRTRRVYRNGEWRTESYIDWQWRSGRITKELSDYLQLGTSRLHGALTRRIGRFDLGALVDYRPELLAGFRAQAYDVGLTEAWDEGRRRMREDVRRACERDTGSAHVRNLSVAADFDEERWRYVLLPIYVGAYSYEGKVHRVLINGQSGVIAGHKPVLWWRVWGAIALAVSPGILLGLIGLPLLLVGVGVLVLPVALIALIAAGIWGASVVREATASEGGRDRDPTTGGRG